MSDKLYTYARQQELRELAYLAEGIDGEDGDPGAIQVLRDLDANVGWVVL